MKISLILIAALWLKSCGMATENREKMDAMAKRTSDSLLNAIDSSLLDPLRQTDTNKHPQHTSTYVFEYK